MKRSGKSKYTLGEGKNAEIYRHFSRSYIGIVFGFRAYSKQEVSLYGQVYCRLNEYCENVESTSKRLRQYLKEIVDVIKPAEKDAPFATDFEDLSLSVGVGGDMHEITVRVMYHQIVWRNAWFCCEKGRKVLDDVKENEGFRP